MGIELTEERPLPEAMKRIIAAALAQGLDKVQLSFLSNDPYDLGGLQVNDGWQIALTKRLGQNMYWLNGERYLDRDAMRSQYLHIDCWVWSEPKAHMSNDQTLDTEGILAWIAEPCPWVGTPSETERAALSHDTELITAAFESGWETSRELDASTMFMAACLDEEVEADLPAPAIAGEYHFRTSNPHYNQPGHELYRGDDDERDVQSSDSLTLTRLDVLDTSSCWSTAWGGQPYGQIDPLIAAATASQRAPWFMGVFDTRRGDEV